MSHTALNPDHPGFNQNGGSLVEDNVIVGNVLNNGGNMQSQITGSGTFIETGANVCGTNTTCP